MVLLAKVSFGCILRHAMVYFMFELSSPFLRTSANTRTEPCWSCNLGRYVACVLEQQCLHDNLSHQFSFSNELSQICQQAKLSHLKQWKFTCRRRKIVASPKCCYKLWRFDGPVRTRMLHKPSILHTISHHWALFFSGLREGSTLYGQSSNSWLGKNYFCCILKNSNTGATRAGHL